MWQQGWFFVLITGPSWRASACAGELFERGIGAFQYCSLWSRVSPADLPKPDRLRTVTEQAVARKRTELQVSLSESAQHQLSLTQTKAHSFATDFCLFSEALPGCCHTFILILGKSILSSTIAISPLARMQLLLVCVDASTDGQKLVLSMSLLTPSAWP